MTAARPLAELPAKPLKKKSREALYQILTIPAIRDRVLPGPVEYDEMQQCPTINRVPLADHHVTEMLIRIEAELKDHNQKPLEYSDEMAHKVIDTAAREASFHPVEEYLSSLQWDGVPRIHNLLDDVLNAPVTHLNQTLLRCWLISAVARVFKPGCKADGVLILQGAQGAGKSTFFAVLGGEWFSDSQIDMGSKDAAMACARSWIIELAELAAIGKRDLETIKAFITSTADDVRPPYGRRIVHLERRCVFGGSSNQEEILHDPTGNRRFWILPVGPTIDTALLRDQRDQVWAEAVYAFRRGEHWHLDGREQGQLAAEQQRFEASDSWTAPILGFMESRLASTPPTTAEILDKAVDMHKSQVKRADEMRVAAIMAKAGYKKTRAPAANGKRPWVWEKA